VSYVGLQAHTFVDLPWEYSAGAQLFTAKYHHGRQYAFAFLVVVQVGVQLGADLQGLGVVVETDGITSNRRLVDIRRDEGPASRTFDVVTADGDPLAAESTNGHGSRGDHAGGAKAFRGCHELMAIKEENSAGQGTAFFMGHPDDGLGFLPDSVQVLHCQSS